MVREGDARILFSLDRHGTLTITARRGGTVMTMRVLDAHRAGLGPGRAATRGAVPGAAARGEMRVARVVGRVAQADAVVFDGTSLAAHAADEHRRMAHEGGIRRRRHHRAFLAVELGPGDRIAIIAIAAAGENAGDAPSFRPLAEAAVECGALGPGTHVLADRAHATREIISWCADHGARAVIPARTGSSGKSMGSMEWRRHVVENPVPPGMRRRFMRGGDVQSLPPGVRVRAQRGRMEENGYGRRAAVEYVIGAFKRIFDGAVASRRPGLVALEMARKAAIHSAARPSPPPRATCGAGAAARAAGAPAARPCPQARPRRLRPGAACARFRPQASKAVPSHTTPSGRPQWLKSRPPRAGPRGVVA